jgi:hypothetical protein
VRSLARPIRAGTLAEGEELASNLLRMVYVPGTLPNVGKLSQNGDSARTDCEMRRSSAAREKLPSSETRINARSALS